MRMNYFTGGGEIPTHLMSLVELVLDPNDRLLEEKRLMGENDVSSVVYLILSFKYIQKFSRSECTRLHP